MIRASGKGISTTVVGLFLLQVLSTRALGNAVVNRIHSAEVQTCLNTTAIMFMGDSTTRGIADCLLELDENLKMEGNMHDYESFTLQDRRIFYEYAPQLPEDYHPIPKPFRYHDDPPTSFNGMIHELEKWSSVKPKGRRNQNLGERIIDFFERMYSGYRAYGDRDRVVVIVGGIKLSKEVISEVLRWKYEQMSRVNLIFRDNGPNLVPKDAAIFSCTSSSTTGVCVNGYKKMEKRREVNKELKKYVFEQVKEWKLDPTEVAWMDMDFLYDDWPSNYDPALACACHYHFLKKTGLQMCPARMQKAIGKFLNLACRDKWDPYMTV